jgi:hypothetical protein
MTTEVTTERFVLPTDADLATAVSACKDGKLELDSLIEFCTSKPFNLADSGLLVGIVDGETYGQIMAKQGEMLLKQGVKQGKDSAISTDGLRLAIAKKGGLSLYGMNTRFPETKYVDQWARQLQWLKAPEDNPVSVFISSAEPREFEKSDFYGDFKPDKVNGSEFVGMVTADTKGKFTGSEPDRKYWDEIVAGKHNDSHELFPLVPSEEDPFGLSQIVSVKLVSKKG